MEANDLVSGARADLRSWGRRRRSLDAERDTTVLAALKAGISKEEIHQSMGIARTTIDRIQKEASDG